MVVPYPASNSSVRSRAIAWLDRLTASGRVPPSTVEVHGPGFGRLRRIDGEHVLLVRNVRRFTRGGTERHLLERADLGVYDLDDGLPWDHGGLPGLGHWYKRLVPRSLVARRAAMEADRMIVGNATLAEWAQRWCPDIRLIPTCIEPSDYAPKRSWELQDPPVIGWIGSPATEHYLTDIAPALGEVHRRTGAVLRIISGAGRLERTLAGFATRSAWFPGSEHQLAEWDVGLMPLRDGVYERAKCGYKLLQYAATGLPAVASPVGVNRDMLAAMGGDAPETTTEWVDALVGALERSAAERSALAERGHRMAMDYSYDAWQDAWLDAVDW